MFDDLPFGVDDLDPRIRWQTEDEIKVRCFINGCSKFVTSGKAACPVHGIRSHSGVCHYEKRRFQGQPTHSYLDLSRNLIIDRETGRDRIAAHDDKRGGERLGNENSEDALTWNVFRTLQKSQLLGGLVRQLLDVTDSSEPAIYFWGLSASDDLFQTWDLLRRARNQFERNLPVKSVPTEPDLALYLPGHYLVLIEAKFTSPNNLLPFDKQKQSKILEFYNWPEKRVLDSAKASSSDHLAHQLWRNMIFADWMAAQDGPSTKAFLINLVRECYEEKTCSDFRSLLCDGFRDRFVRLTWEQVYASIPDTTRECRRLRQYMRSKTAHLRKAFQL